MRKLIFSWNKKTRQKQVNLPITKAHVEKRKSFPFGHLWRSFLTDKRADCEPLWLPEPLEWLTSPAPRKSENWYFVHIFFSSFPVKNGILLPKLLWPTVRKNCSSDREKLLKFNAEGWEFAKIFWSLEQFIQTVKDQNNFC